MFPDAHDCPADFPQRMRLPAIALDVGRQLRTPIGRVRRWVGPVIRATVPKAPIYEDSDLLPRKNDVSSNRAGCLRSVDSLVLAEPSASAVKKRPEPHLWRGVDLRIASTDSRSSFARGSGVGWDLGHLSFCPHSSKNGPLSLLEPGSPSRSAMNRTPWMVSGMFGSTDGRDSAV